MSLFIAMFGGLGLAFGRLGVNSKKTSTPPITGGGGVGSPMGLLLALTYSS